MTEHHEVKATTFLERTLEIVPPWYVESGDLDRESGSLSVRLNFESGGTFPCGTCGRPDCKAYDTYWKRCRHLDFFGHRAFLHAPCPRVLCPLCGVRRAMVPWARPRSGFTHGLEKFVADLAGDLPVTTIARLLGEHDTRLGYMLRKRTVWAQGATAALAP